MAYNKTVWVNGSEPALNAENLNKIEDALAAQDSDISDLKSEIEQSGGGGQPVPVTLASEMTDTEQIYVYLGEETGYDYGYIYVYLNDAWTKTGLYGRGQNGSDGFSPQITVAETSTGVSITATDRTGTTVATVENGTATAEQVASWLDNHPEATTTVEDGAVTTAKLADGAVTQAKLDPNLELGVKDNSVTTPKLVNHAVTMGKTDFYYEESAEFVADWYTTGTDANGQELTYTGISTVHKFTKTGKPARAINIDTSVNQTITEDDFFETVNTPDTIS